MEVDYKDRYQRLLVQNKDLQEDLTIANAKIGDKVWLGASRDMKINRQRKALAELNRRVRVQRLQLRKLNELERGLRKEEWLALKEEFAHELNEDEWDIED